MKLKMASGIFLSLAFLLASNSLMACPYRSFSHNEKRAGTLKLTRNSGQFQLAGEVISLSVDVYDVCTVSYTTQTSCSSDCHGNQTCTSYDVPSYSYSTDSEVVDSIFTPVQLNLPASALLVPGENEKFSITYNAYMGGDPQVNFPHYYNEYRLGSIDGTATKTGFDLTLEHLGRNRVTPEPHIEKMRVRNLDHHLVTRFHDMAASFFKLHENPEAEYRFDVMVKRRKFIRYSVVVSKNIFIKAPQELPTEVEFDLGSMPISKRKHGVWVKTQVKNSKFYNDKSSVLTYITFYPHKVGREKDESADD